MVKQGPCCHCGITSTPLWRNGPPRKPVLCNACGSRWRVKGSLANYIPLHAQDSNHLDFQGSENCKEEGELFRTKRKNFHLEVPCKRYIKNGNSCGGSDLFLTSYEDSRKRSSSGSVISCPESCTQLVATDGTNISDLSNFKFPLRRQSRKRGRPSIVEKLRRDLCKILQEQGSVYPSGSSEEVLIFKREDPRFSDEIGLGSVLLKPPVREEEPKSQSSEVSSSQGGKDRLIGAIGLMEKLEEIPAKRPALKEKYLDIIPFGDSNSLQCMHSPQMRKNAMPDQPSNKESFATRNEITSCSTFLVDYEISVHN
ncbi:hypothetical protein NE237_019128 [Protea cynaroides]|uniref:GATA-type domain-containing protein n=1 Tax=Protea cynaroides TaxID=273540 RepID=A0A9Q0KBA6_9MAGN|nr:hypothetical protein NE237_019128 [Protea cynaroides]